MDYGYQLLRHVVQQVLGNLGPAARITLVPVLGGYALSAVIMMILVGPTAFEVIAAQNAGIAPEEVFGTGEALALGGGMIIAVILVIITIMVTYAWAAVGWHRYVLVEEYPTGYAAKWNGDFIKSYIGAAIRLGLAMIAIAFVVGFIIAFVGAILPLPAILFVLGIGFAVALTWCAARLGLVLPSAALGTYMKLGESWAATERVSGSILLPVLVLPLAFAIMGVLLGVIPIIGFILSLVLYWLQFLMNLALMTTLYGNLVEGRQLN